MDLGNLGVARDPVPRPDEFDTFGWFGMTVRVQPVYDDLELIDLLVYADSVEVNGFMALTATKKMMQIVIHPDDFDQFWALAKENGQQAEDMGGLWRRIVSFTTGRPTQRPTDSSGGPLSTGGSSPDAPSSQGTTSPGNGRPDLQVIHDTNAATRARVRAEIAAAG